MPSHTSATRKPSKAFSTAWSSSGAKTRVEMKLVPARSASAARGASPAKRGNAAAMNNDTEQATERGTLRKAFMGECCKRAPGKVNEKFRATALWNCHELRGQPRAARAANADPS